MKIEILSERGGDVIARGSYRGGPDYEFVVASDGQVYFRVVGDSASVWAGPDIRSFQRIVAAWSRYEEEMRNLSSETAQLERVGKLRRELTALGALPVDMPPDPEPLWSLLVFEAENGLGNPLG